MMVLWHEHYIAKNAMSNENFQMDHTSLIAHEACMDILAFLELESVEQAQKSLKSSILDIGDILDTQALKAMLKK